MKITVFIIIILFSFQMADNKFFNITNILPPENFEIIKNFILVNGQKMTYCQMYNNIFYNMAVGINNYSGNSAARNSYYNNTVYHCGIGIDNSNAYGMYKNNICIGNTTNWGNVTSASGGNNAGESGNTMPGSGNVITTAYATFIDTNNATLNLHLSAGGNCINAGDSTGLRSIFVKDVDDTIRIAQYDIGADEWIHPKTWIGGEADNN